MNNLGHMLQNWTSIVKSNWILSKIYLGLYYNGVGALYKWLKYIYIYILGALGLGLEPPLTFC